MANGKIVIDTHLDSTGLEEGLSRISQMGVKGGGALSNAFGNIKNIAGVAVGIKAITGAFNMLKSSLDGGIARFDTMQRFPRMMEQLGYSAQESQKSIESLTKGIEGLPTTLDDVVSTTQSLTMLTGDLTRATDLTLALNNAFLAGGKGPAEAKRGMVQFQQMLSRGEVDLVSYRTLMETMEVGLNKVSESFGLAADNPYALYDALADGSITFDEFANRLIELNDGVDGFAAMALINSEGIANSFELIRISFVRGIEGMIEAINNRMLEMGLGTIASNIAKLKGVVDSAFGFMIQGVHLFFDAIQLIREPLAEITGLFGALAPSADNAGGAVDGVAMSIEELTTIAESWDGMTLAEKQATVDTMGKDDLEELMTLLGVDFENIPDEYTKNAYLNAYGADALEELLWVTGKWHDLTFEEKRVVLETQIENEEIKEAIEARGLWNNEEFYSQLADIDMSDDDAYEQIIALIDYWGELEGLEPIGIKVEAETKQASTELTRFQRNFTKIVKGIGRAVEGLSNFFEPVIDFVGDWVDASIESLEGYVDAFAQLVDGDWSGAWKTYVETTSKGFENGAAIIAKHLPRMWENITGVVDNILEWAGSVDWGAVGTTIMSGIGIAIGTAVNSISDIGTTIFTYITEKVEAVNWSEVGEDIGKWVGDALQKGLDAIKNFDYTKLNAMFAALGEMIDTLGLALLNLAAGALVGLAKSFGFEKEMEAITQLLDDLGNIDFNGDFDHIAEQIRQAFQDAFKGWNLNDWMPKLEWQWDKKNWQFDWSTGEVFEVDIETGARVFITKAELAETDWPQLVNEATKLGFISDDGQGSYVINTDIEVDPNVTHIDQQALVDEIAEKLGVPTVQLKAKTEFNQADIDKEFGEGSYDIYTEAEVKVDAYLEKGYTDAQIESLLKSVMTDEQYDMYLDIKAFMDSFTVDPSATTEADSQIQAAFSGKEETEVEVPIRLSPTIAGGSGKQGAMTGAVGGGLDSNIISGLQASIQASMETAQATVTTGMSGLDATMTAGMAQMSATVSAGVARAAFAMAAGSIGAFAAGAAMGMGFYTGLASMQGAIVALASSIASSAASAMRSALKIASPSKVTTEIGRFTGMGLVKGLHAMIAPVDRASEELAMSAVPSLTTINPNLAMGLNRVAGGFNPSRNGSNAGLGDSKDIIESLAGIKEEIRSKSQYINMNGRIVAEVIQDDTDSLLANSGYLNELMS